MMRAEHWTGVVLAGGTSSRMGRDKALIVRDSQPLLVHAVRKLSMHVDEVLVIGDPAKYGQLHTQVIADDAPGMGPLGGLTTALRCTANDRVLVLACDLPNVNDDLFMLLKRELGPSDDAVVPRHAYRDGRSGGTEPLAAAYHRRCLSQFNNCIATGQLKMTMALGIIRTKYVDLEPGDGLWPADLFHNLNSPTDL